MRIAEEKIEEVRSSADIVDLISGFIQLKRRGKNFIGLCPFHQEKTPSFTVSPDKQIYHCFGCHAGGNVFRFLMDYKNISFIESVQEIAGSLGIELEAETGHYDKKQSALEILYETNVAAAKYFVNNLVNSTEGKTALSYLKKRKLENKILTTFGVGYALPGWDNFVRFAAENKIDLEKAEELGLIDRKNNNDFYDKFRGRIIFPILSTNGRVIAFGGRIIEKNDNVAKYLNSPESQIYSKRRVLYGLYHSKEEIRKLDQAILVEGYMDVIALYKHGVKNIVASSGTALTDEQVQLLSRFTRNVIVLFDADAAGQKAATRSIETFLKQDFSIKVLTLPDGEDPDSYINNYGKEKFREEVGKSGNFLEYQVNLYKKSGDLEDPDKQVTAIREIVRLLALINDELKRNMYLKSISEKFKLREKLLENELLKLLSSSRENKSFRPEQKQVKEHPNDGKIKKQSSTSFKLEKELIKLLLQGNEKITGHIFDHITPDDFVDEKLKEISTLVYEAFMEDNFSPSYILEKVEDDELKNYILSLSMEQETISNKRWSDVITDFKLEQDMWLYCIDLVKRVELDKIDKLIKENNARLASAANEEAQKEILRLIFDLMNERKSVQNQHLN
ncbi:MAG: DNA primase [Melioribacteraceae bacterium]|nr:MAG: DNA primase [Melioribacteraceae bacterium]